MYVTVFVEGLSNIERFPTPTFIDGVSPWEEVFIPPHFSMKRPKISPLEGSNIGERIQFGVVEEFGGPGNIS